ncbi:MAG: cobalamin biosynthesis protein CbiM [Syntrophomonadaceae bacterium]|nr:cobalamin biosynthesis protein CbiM [Syntrophomonadaceae bacterium]
MHMADALISPAVGGTMLAVTAGLAAYSAKKITNEMDEKKIPLMGVMGAFVFASQMINFTIPATGSSGHLGGGLLLAILLGPYAGFLTMTSILLIQALFFADGGLLAYGCNVFNLGFCSCFVSYPFIYRWFTRQGLTSRKILWGATASGIVGLQLGAFSVVAETLASGKTELPFSTFVLLMQPIHLGIGLVEGLVTAAIVTYVWRARPEILEKAAIGGALGDRSIKKFLTGLAIGVVLIGGALSWFASTSPDGLEWSMERTAGTTEIEATDGIHQLFADLQSRTAFMPDYGFKAPAGASSEEAISEETASSWPAVDAGTSAAGLVGGSLTLVLAALIGYLVSLSKKKGSKAAA